MSQSAAFEVKGWCPGALKPMRSGDGLIVRVRPRCGAFAPDQLAALADAARRFGNGHLDLTRRANLQIRGVDDATLPGLYEVLGALGLLDPTADAEAIRNLMIDPLAGIDPDAAFDVRGIAAELAQRLMADPALWALPAKFGFVVDGGSRASPAQEPADIRVAAFRDGTGAAVAIGLGTGAGTVWLGSTSAAQAAGAAIATAAACLDAMPGGAPLRLREMTDASVASVRAAMRLRLDPLPPDFSTPPARKPDAVPMPRVGALDLGGGRFAVGLGVPFGRIEADQLRTLAAAVPTFGIGDIRLSPWRVLYVQAADLHAAQALRDLAAGAGLIADAADPLLRIEACPGAPACGSTTRDTRGDGRRLAALLPRFGFAGVVHISGCAKGCARSTAADLVLVGADGGYGIARHATARDATTRHGSFSELIADPGLLLAPVGDMHD